MSLAIATAVASDSLATLQDQMALVSRNVAGANLKGYSAKSAQVTTGLNGSPELVAVSRNTNSFLERRLVEITGTEAKADFLAEALQRIQENLNIGAGSAADAAGDGSAASAIARLRSALQQFSAAPANTTTATAVVAAAKATAQALNDAGAAMVSIRTQTDQDIEASVKEINSLLSDLKKVNDVIVSTRTSDADLADNLDQRDQLLARLAQNIGIRTVRRSNNDLVVYTDSGVTLFETTPRHVSFQPSGALGAGGSGNPVQMDGVRITGTGAQFGIGSGKLAGLVELRDVVAPRVQSQLDELARGLIVAFAEYDQSGGGGPALAGLFTDGTNVVPGATLVPGLAGSLRVNATVDPAQGGDPMRLRDGGIAAPGNPAYVYNPGGAPGYSGRIQQLIAAFSTPQSFDPAAGLGASMGLTSYASASVGWLANERQQAENVRSYQSALLQQTQQAVSDTSGVNLDDQMSRMLAIENSYQASTRLLAAINAMYSTLFDAMRI